MRPLFVNNSILDMLPQNTLAASHVDVTDADFSISHKEKDKCRRSKEKFSK